MSWSTDLSIHRRLFAGVQRAAHHCAQRECAIITDGNGGAIQGQGQEILQRLRDFWQQFVPVCALCSKIFQKKSAPAASGRQWPLGRKRFTVNPGAPAGQTAKKAPSGFSQKLYKDWRRPALTIWLYAEHNLMADISSLINPPDEVETKPIVAELPSEETGVKTEAAVADDNDDESKVSQDSILQSFEKIKTHFPAARIKKIMQSDEDIGKVAQATPVVVGRALEIFMANLVEAGIIEAKKAGVRRISAQHIRTAVENTEQFDFLVDVMSKYLYAKN